MGFDSHHRVQRRLRQWSAHNKYRRIKPATIGGTKSAITKVCVTIFGSPDRELQLSTSYNPRILRDHCMSDRIIKHLYMFVASDQKRTGRLACLIMHLLVTLLCTLTCLTRFSMCPCMVCRYFSTGLNATWCLRRHVLKPSECSNSADRRVWPWDNSPRARPARPGDAMGPRAF